MESSILTQLGMGAFGTMTYWNLRPREPTSVPVDLDLSLQFCGQRSSLKKRATGPAENDQGSNEGASGDCFEILARCLLMFCACLVKYDMLHGISK
eukprot:1018678-Amphidinium_carterae.2